MEGDFDREQVVKDVAFHVHEAALCSAFRMDASEHDQACAELHRLCIEHGDVDAYQEGWERGTASFRS